MRLVLPVCTIVLAMSVAVAQGQLPQTPAQAFNTFLAENGPNFQADWNPATGTPTDVWGAGVPVSTTKITTADQARAAADAFMARYPDLLGQGGSTFVEDIQTKSGQVWILGYRQDYQGLPCVGGRVKMLIHEVGRLALFGSSALPVPAGFVTTPQVGIEQARAVAFVNQGVELKARPEIEVSERPHEQLVVFGNANASFPTSVRLAWEIAVEDMSQLKVGRAYIDARTGQQLHWENDLHTCGFENCSFRPENHQAHEAELAESVQIEHGAPIPGSTNVTGNVSSWVQTTVGPSDARTLQPMAGIRVEIVGGGGIGFCDLAGNFNITYPGTAPVSVRIQFAGERCRSVTASQGTTLNLTATVTPGTPANIVIYSSSPAQFDGSQNNTYWGTDFINRFTRSLGGVINTSLGRIRATVNIASTCNAFYSNYTINFYASGGGCVNTAYPSVIYHEWGHGLDSANGGLNTNDGMSEGSADVLSMAALDDPTLGKDFFGPGTFVRTGLNTRTWPAGGGVHQQGETWMGWFWDAYTNMIGTIGKPAALALYRQYGVGFFAANPSTQASGVRTVFVLDDDDGNLSNGTPHCSEFARACVKRNLPNPTSCTN